MKAPESGVERLGKPGEKRLAGSQDGTLAGHVKFCLHPKSNEKKLEDFKKVSTSV